MNGYDPSQKVGHGTPIPFPESTSPAKPSGTESGIHNFFHHLLDVVNPLQHLPVISTIYRAVTGEHIGTFEKIAGDTLYGGMWGAVSSVADTIFTAVTGKDFGDTALSLFTGPHPAVAQAPAAATPAPVASTTPAATQSADVAALSSALTNKGVDNDLAQRALAAYRRSMSLPNAALAN